MSGGRGRKNGSQALRLCRILDDLRDAYPNAVPIATLAARHGVGVMQIRHDMHRLATAYEVEVEQCNARTFIAWAGNQRAARAEGVAGQ